jgi:hypothetical protein
VDFRQVFGRESHKVDGLSRTTHWAWGAVIAALCSLALAKGPGVLNSHGADYLHGGAQLFTQMRGVGHERGTAAAAPVPRASHDASAGRDPRSRRAGPASAGVTYSYDFRTYRPGVRRVVQPADYGGALTPVSAETRPAQRSQQNGPMRNGSIRADVARYNEERGAARAFQRPNDDSRPPESSPYRN